MAGAVLFLVLIAYIWEARTQNCPSGPILPGQSKPPFLPSTTEHCGPFPFRPQDFSPTECGLFAPNYGSVPFSSLKGSMSLENLGQPNLGDSAMRSSFVPNLAPPSAFCRPSTSTCETGAKPIPVVSEPCSQTKPTILGSCGQQSRPSICPFGAPKPTSIVESVPGPILRTESPCFSNLPTRSPFVSNPCNTFSSPTVIVDDKLSNTLADSLQLYLLNDLIESSMEYANMPNSCGCNRQFNTNLCSLNKPSNAVQSTYTYAETTNSNSLSSNSQSTSATAIAEVNSASSGLATSYVGLKNKGSPVSSSVSFADDSSSISEPYRSLNSYGSAYAGSRGTPAGSSLSISEVTNKVEPFANQNLCAINGVITPLPACPINVEPNRFSNNLCGCSNQLLSPLPSIGAKECSLKPPKFCGFPEQYKPTPVSIAEVSQFNPIQSNFGTFSNINPYFLQNLTPVGYPYCFPSQPSPVSSAIAIAETTPTSQSSLSISEVKGPTSCGTDSTSSVSSSIAVSEINTASSSTVTAAEAVVSNTEESCHESSSTIVSSAVSSSNSIEADNLAVAVASVDNHSSSPCASEPTLSTAEVISSSITPLSPTFELGPINLAVEIPSSISPALSSQLFGGAIRTGCVPLMYELQIPSSIPAQLSCSLAADECYSPVLCMRVEPC